MKLDTQAQVAAAERTLRLTWIVVAGSVLFSVLTVTPLVERVTPDRWDWTAPILPIVVDAAVVIVVRVDAIVARLGGRPGGWPAALRWLTGGMTLALNVGDSALRGDLVGVGVHVVAPTLLIVTAEAALKWRRAITAAVERIERERADAEALKARERREAEDRSRAERQAARDAEERQREHARQAEAERREQERAEREREREHAARLAREERADQARLEREREERAEARAAAEREAARQEREEAARREREEKARRKREQDQVRELQDRAREHKEAEARKATEARKTAAAASTPRPSVSATVSTTAHEPPTGKKMSEAAARKAIAEAVRDGRSQRQMAALTGWSTGWIAARCKELEQVPGQTELEGVTA
ncbi:DUF2637 domain-containing protein [Streptomyces abikoensis]|uniref:DUF2637 domain-containing protein n=1 Tax=Streptomyces abikoensis TaxID=97398 RepID=UPI0037196718